MSIITSLVHNDRFVSSILIPTTFYFLIFLNWQLTMGKEIFSTPISDESSMLNESKNFRHSFLFRIFC